MHAGGGGGGGGGGDARSGSARLGVVSALLSTHADVDASIMSTDGVLMQRSMYGTLIEDRRGLPSKKEVEAARNKSMQAHEAGYGGLKRQELGDIASGAQNVYGGVKGAGRPKIKVNVANEEEEEEETGFGFGEDE